MVPRMDRPVAAAGWILVLGSSTLLGADAAPPGNTPQARSGRMITIEGGIDTGLKNRVLGATRAAVREGAQVIIFELATSGQSDFGPCYDLARAIAELGGQVERTVAFVPGDLFGHGVLIALACDEIIMSEGARIGNALADRPEESSLVELNAYQEVARNKGHDPWLARAMLERRLRLLAVKTPDGTQYLPEDTAGQLERDLKNSGRTVNTEVVSEAGEPLVLAAEAARRYGLILQTAASRRQVALLYGLPEQVAAQDMLRSEALRPVVLRLEGAIDNRLYGYVRRRLHQAGQKGHDLLFVAIDSSYGDATAASNIASSLGAFPGRTVAWVRGKATGPATLVVFGCHELVVAPEATLGRFEAPQASAEEYRELARSAVRLAERGEFPQALVEGLIDPQAKVLLLENRQHPGQRAYRTAADFEVAEDRDQWEIRQVVKEPGTPWVLDGQKAHDLQLATALAPSEEALKSLYDLTGTLPVLQPGWVDALVHALTSMGGTVFLLVVAMMCLYIELQVPGFGIAGLLSALCFALFFWSRFLSETANSLEIMLFLLGVAFLAVELFVLPGFGLAGVLGIGLVLFSLLLSLQSFSMPRTEAEVRTMATNVLTLGAALVVVGASAWALARYFPQIPVLSQMMLAPPEPSRESFEPLAAEETALHRLVGQHGTAASPLRPAGRMELDHRFYDVVTRGEFVEPGTPVEVVEVHNNRIVVRDASS